MMKNLWKRNAVAAVVLLFVCAAIFLNGKYANKATETEKILGQSTLVSEPSEVQSVETAETKTEPIAGDYFATARLTRQQARDNALSILQETASEDTLDETLSAELTESVQTIAGYAMKEAQIENMVTAKGYADCVVFLGEDSVSVVVPTQENGLQTEDIAKITDIVKQETGIAASGIKILEAN